MDSAFSGRRGGGLFPASFATAGLLVLAAVATTYFAADLLIPIVFSVMLYLLLSPATRALTRVTKYPAISAGLLVTSLVALFILAVTTLAEPAEQWLATAPKSIRELRAEFMSSDGHLAGIQELAEEVDQLKTANEDYNAQTVVVRGSGLIENVLGGLPRFAAISGTIVFLTYFLLASGDGLLRALTACGRTWTGRRRIVKIAREMQGELSHYLATITVINAALGALVGSAMYLLGMPNPVLWGAVAAMFNFAPYAGALVTTAILLLVGLASFDTLTESLLPAGAFLMLTIVEGQLVTPAVLGRRLAMSPIVVFLSVVCWGWLWGVAGALMAVPLVTIAKVLLQHVSLPSPFRSAVAIADIASDDQVSLERARSR